MISAVGGSGTRVFSRIARDAGVFMGNGRDDLEDALLLSPFYGEFTTDYLPRTPRRSFTAASGPTTEQPDARTEDEPGRLLGEEIHPSELYLVHRDSLESTQGRWYQGFDLSADARARRPSFISGSPCVGSTRSKSSSSRGFSVGLKRSR